MTDTGRHETEYSFDCCLPLICVNTHTHRWCKLLVGLTQFQSTISRCWCVLCRFTERCSLFSWYCRQCGFTDVLGLLGVSFYVSLLNNVPCSLVSGCCLLRECTDFSGFEILLCAFTDTLWFWGTSRWVH